MDKVAEIINRVLSTIDRNPEIVDQILSPLEAAVGELARTAERSIDEVADTVGSTAPRVDRSIAELAGEPAETEAVAEEPAVAEAPEDEA